MTLSLTFDPLGQFPDSDSVFPVSDRHQGDGRGRRGERASSSAHVIADHQVSGESLCLRLLRFLGQTPR